MPRDGSFALALLGSLRRVHEPILNSLASKRIVDIFPCSLIVPIIVILPNLHFLVEDEYLRAQNITTRWMKSQSLARRRRRLMSSTIRLERLCFRLYYRFIHDRFSLFPGLDGLANHIQWLHLKGHYCFAGTSIAFHYRGCCAIDKRGWRRRRSCAFQGCGGYSPLRGRSCAVGGRCYRP